MRTTRFWSSCRGTVVDEHGRPRRGRLSMGRGPSPGENGYVDTSMSTATSSSEPDKTGLPSELLAAIAYQGGGRVVLVTGAGCSVEAPTSLPLAGALARDGYRRLVDNDVLAADACATPEDLSAVADAVVAAVGSQVPLVETFPPDDFRRATPNDGHLVAAALIREGAISNILSLNFDLSQDTALTTLGARNEVATIGGPYDHARLVARNLIYLHRNINAPPEELILRTNALEEWKGHWEEVVAKRILGGSVTVFAGLGSPARVLVETTRSILETLGSGASVFVVDPVERDRSAFFAELGLSDDAYIQIGWTDFMQRLGNRVVKEHRAGLERACAEMSKQNEWAEENVAATCDRLCSLGLVRLGKLRASWLLRDEPYAPHPAAPESERLLADLIIGIAILERLTERTARFGEDGFVEMEMEQRAPIPVLLCSGGGSSRWARLEGEVRFLREKASEHRRAPHGALVAGVVGGRVSVAPPPNISGQRPSDDLVSGADEEFTIVTVDDLRGDPTTALRLIA